MQMVSMRVTNSTSVNAEKRNKCSAKRPSLLHFHTLCFVTNFFMLIRPMRMIIVEIKFKQVVVANAIVSGF